MQATSGYSVFEANVELLEVKLHDGLSEEAALTRIEALQNAASRGPLYVHCSVRDRQRRPQSGYGRFSSSTSSSSSSSATAAAAAAAQPGGSAARLIGATYGLPIPAHSIPFGAAGDADRELQLPGAGKMPVLEFLQIISKNLDLPFPRSFESDNTADEEEGGNGKTGNAAADDDDNDDAMLLAVPASPPRGGTHEVFLKSEDPANRGRSWRVVPNLVGGIQPRPLQISAAMQLGVIPCPGTKHYDSSL